ncbi:unnamed protein product [Cuscuta campestris]|uniref:Uncharacterized protein n=1 Tax=Cuscuta campestris TaxID=132261 RepID=A0A484N6B2_9ASTE|nr:unnamed protein product [Cuscuta campestris]
MTRVEDKRMFKEAIVANKKSIFKTFPLKSRSKGSSSTSTAHASSNEPVASCYMVGALGGSATGSYQIGSTVHSLDESPNWIIQGNGKLCSDAVSASKSDLSNIRTPLASITIESSAAEFDMPSRAARLSASSQAQNLMPFDLLVPEK